MVNSSSTMILNVGPQVSIRDFFVVVFLVPQSTPSSKGL